MQMQLLKVKEYDTCSQIDKIKEEFSEFFDAEPHSTEDIMEALDIITATWTYITHEYKKKIIEVAVKAHEKKLKGRGWEFKGIIKIELEDK